MLKKLLALFAAFTMTTSLPAQEFGPLAEAPDGIADIYTKLALTGAAHTDGEAAPDNLGAFRFICSPGHLLSDDPIVYPGQAGKSHPHQFFGNYSANANSTYATFRSTGITSCLNEANRSAYWMPAMYNGAGKAIRPDLISIYYKRAPKNNPECTIGNPLYQGECVALPNGLRFIFGYDMLTSTTPTGNFTFRCEGPGMPQTTYSDMVTAAAGCPTAGQHDLALVITAPECWDGVNLDSPNHRSHLANFDTTGGVVKCPSTHPKVIPHFALGARWKVDATLNTSGTWVPGQATWYLSCDNMYGMALLRPGTCFHTDYFEAWNQAVKKMWTDNCIDRWLSCSAGDLGNGYRIAPANELEDGIAQPRIVNIPAQINTPFSIHVHPPE